MPDHPTPSDTVAAKIRAHREQLGLTREKLAQKCAERGWPELTASAIVNIETGRRNPQTRIRRREITIEELAAFEKVFGVRLLDPAPLCARCEGSPPSGFACRTCGAEA